MSDCARSQAADELAADAAEVERMLLDESWPVHHGSEGSARQLQNMTEGGPAEDESFDIPEPEYTPIQEMELAVMRERAAVSSLVMRCHGLAATGVSLEDVMLDSRTEELRQHWKLLDGNELALEFFKPTLMEMERIEIAICMIREDQPVSTTVLHSLQWLLQQKRKYLEELIRAWEDVL